MSEQIVVRGLRKQFPNILAVAGVDLTVAAGEVFGLLGPNGAGKTTTMRIITGFMPATSGTVRVEGFDVFEQSSEVRRRMGYLPENPPLYNDMSVAPYLRFVARLKGLGRREVGEALERVLATCGLDSVRDRLLGHLSKGYRQRVGLAQALIHDPPVLVLDEPTIGLDPRQIRDIRALVRTLGGKRTIVLSTHILSEVMEVCDKVVIINDGRVALAQVLVAPPHDRHDRGVEGEALLRQLVLEALGLLLVAALLEDARADQELEPRREDVARDPEVALHHREPLDPVEALTQDQQGPALAEDVHRTSDGARRQPQRVIHARSVAPPVIQTAVRL